jgi:hypothetical protein
MLLQLEEPMGEAWKPSKTNPFFGIGKIGQNCAFMFCYIELVILYMAINRGGDRLNKCRPIRKICHFSS